MEISSGCAQSSAPAAQIYQIISIKIGRSSFEKNRDFTFPSAVNSRLVLALALAALASDQSTFVRWRLTRSCRSDLQYLQTKRAQARNDTIIPPSLQRIITAAPVLRQRTASSTACCCCNVLLLITTASRSSAPTNQQRRSLASTSSLLNLEIPTASTSTLPDASRYQSNGVDIRLPMAPLESIMPTPESIEPPLSVKIARAAVRARRSTPVPSYRFKFPDPRVLRGASSKVRAVRFNLKSAVLRRGTSLFWEKQRRNRLVNEGAEAEEDEQDRLSLKEEIERDQNALRKPQSKEELVDLLYRLRQRSTHLHVMTRFHSHPALLSFVSPDSYAVLLRFGYARSDLKVIRHLLDEMTERGIERSRKVYEAALYGFKKRGDVRGVQRTVEAMRERGWISYDFSRDRRDFGEAARGFGDSWKAWGRRGWGSEKAITADIAQEREERKKMQESTTAIAYDEGIGSTNERPPVVIPREFASLSGTLVFQLVDALVHERRGPEAFDVAEMWLERNIPRSSVDASTSVPSSSSTATATTTTTPAVADSIAGFSLSPRAAVEYAPSPIYVHARRYRHLTIDGRLYQLAVEEYNRRALVLMNILLKSLLIHYAPPYGCRSFVQEFRKKFLTIPGTKKAYPDAVTLRQLVMNLRGRKNAWRRSMEVVEWFSSEYGGLPAADSSSFRRRYNLSSSAVLSATTTAELISSSKSATARVELPLARILLNHAVQHHKRLTVGSVSRVSHAEEVRKWWTGLLPEMKRSVGWESRQTVDLLKKARKHLLLLPEPAVQARVTEGRRRYGRKKSVAGPTIA